MSPEFWPDKNSWLSLQKEFHPIFWQNSFYPLRCCRIRICASRFITFLDQILCLTKHPVTQCPQCSHLFICNFLGWKQLWATYQKVNYFFIEIKWFKHAKGGEVFLKIIYLDKKICKLRQTQFSLKNSYKTRRRTFISDTVDYFYFWSTFSREVVWPE